MQAPVYGYWNSKHADPAENKTERISSYGCFKSHMSYEVYKQQLGIYKAIYLIRDPRDIVVSGTYFFKDSSKRKIILRILRRLLPFLTLKSNMKARMTEAILNGDRRLNPAMGMPWNQHIRPYLQDPDILCIQYEYIFHNPIEACQRILEHIGQTRSQADIETAIEAQNIQSMKTDYELSGNQLGTKLVRKGGTGHWKLELEQNQIDRIQDKLGKEMQKLAYPMG